MERNAAAAREVPRDGQPDAQSDAPWDGPPRDGQTTTVAAFMKAVDDVVHMDMDLTEARIRLRAAGVEFLPVVDGVEIVGTVSARELDRGEAEARARDRTELVRNHLSKLVAFCFVDDQPRVARAVMDRCEHGMLLVLDRDRQFVGVVRRDALADAQVPGRVPARDTVAADRTAVSPARARGARPGRPPSHGARAKIKD